MSSEPAVRGRLVELVRLIFIALFALAGYRIGISGGQVNVTAPRLLVSVFIGSGVGYVVGGVLGRLTFKAVTGLEEDLRRKPPAALAGGAIGLTIGLLIAALIMIPLLFFPVAAGWPLIAFSYFSFGYLGYRLGVARNEELFGMVGMKPRAAAVSRGEVHVLDTSALIDGRVADLI